MFNSNTHLIVDLKVLFNQYWMLMSIGQTCSVHIYVVLYVYHKYVYISSVNIYFNTIILVVKIRKHLYKNFNIDKTIMSWLNVQINIKCTSKHV